MVVREQAVEKARTELEDVKTTLEERSTALSKMEGEFEQRVLSAKKERAELDKKAQNLEKRGKELEEKEAASKTERAALESLSATLDLRTKELESKENALATREQDANVSETKLQELKERAQKMKEEREERQKMLEQLEDALSKTEQALDVQLKESASLEEQLKLEASRSEELISQLSATASQETVTTSNERSIAEEEKKDEPKDDATSITAIWPPKTQGEMRQLVNAELGKIIQATEKEELEDPIETEVVMALQEAAHAICYVKKYYDAMKDEFIFFPSVAKTIMSYDLMEEAEKHYFDDMDEIPIEVSAGLRSIACGMLDDDIDEEYMESMAADVDLPP